VPDEEEISGEPGGAWARGLELSRNRRWSWTRAQAQTSLGWRAVPEPNVKAYPAAVEIHAMEHSRFWHGA